MTINVNDIYITAAINLSDLTRYIRNRREEGERERIREKCGKRWGLRAHVCAALAARAACNHIL